MTGEVHPVADLFPMLDGDDLQALADDIAERGLLQPVVLDSDGRVLDGRNRLHACQLAGVEPKFTTYTGDDADGYVLAANVTRRHLTKGQQAMLAAQARAVSGKPLREVAAELGLSKARVAYAATVLEHAPDLVADVSAGTTPLNRAYSEARARKAASTAYDQAVSEAVAAIHEIDRSAWDLAVTLCEVDDLDAFLAWVDEHEPWMVEAIAYSGLEEVAIGQALTVEQMIDRVRAIREAGRWALDDPSVREQPRIDVIAELSERGGRQSTRPTAQ